mgnify:CR=1 FL=1
MSTGKKITLWSVVGVVLALIIVVITLACVSKTYTNYLQKGYTSITVYSKGKEKDVLAQGAVIEKDPEIFAKIGKLVDKASKEKVLTSIFQKTNNVSFELKKVSLTSSNINSLLTNTENKHLVFKYNTEQTITIDDTEVKFYSIIMEIKDNDYLTQTKIYFQTENVSLASSMRSSYQINILTHQAELFDYINELI